MVALGIKALPFGGCIEATPTCKLPYTMYYIPYSIYHILYTIYYIPYTIYSISYTIFGPLIFGNSHIESPLKSLTSKGADQSRLARVPPGRRSRGSWSPTRTALRSHLSKGVVRNIPYDSVDIHVDIDVDVDLDAHVDVDTDVEGRGCRSTAKCSNMLGQ